jgi:hypothetical protein
MSEINEDMNQKNEYIDKITLELLINKNQYNKYLSKNDPKKYEENQHHLQKVQKYKDKIMKLTDDLCKNTKKQYNNEVHDIFDQYVKTCIRFFEMKELENDSEYENKSDEDDVLFGNCEDENNENNENGDVENSKIKSFWGKSVKKSNLANYDIQMFANRKR